MPGEAGGVGLGWLGGEGEAGDETEDASDGGDGEEDTDRRVEKDGGNAVQIHMEEALAADVFGLEWNE